ncbi:MAG: hypothetical protein KDC44_18365, partial [Phaeodactylibacter sp.]|nr:hypothetical protein [Phaeodactylibacter sp.]
ATFKFSGTLTLSYKDKDKASKNSDLPSIEVFKDLELSTPPLGSNFNLIDFLDAVVEMGIHDKIAFEKHTKQKSE